MFRSCCARFFTAIVSSFLFGSTTAVAAVEILEIQLDSPDAPAYIAIYGTDIGPPEEAVIYIGTQTTPLTVTSCDLTLPVPPLDAMGIDCVVAALPLNIPAGDYLVWIDASDRAPD